MKFLVTPAMWGPTQGHCWHGKTVLCVVAAGNVSVAITPPMEARSQGMPGYHNPSPEP